jgi:hypothetical protein
VVIEIAQRMLVHRDGFKSIAAPVIVTMPVSIPMSIG